MAMLIYVRNLLLLSVVGSVLSEVPKDFNMHLENVTRNDSDIYIGEVVGMKLTITFSMTESIDTVVEILTSVKPTIFAINKLDKVRFDKGKNLNISNSAWLTGATLHPGTDQERGAGIVYNTRAVLELETVSNTGESKETIDSQLVIYYELVYVSQAGLSNGTQVFTSAGMEYLDAKRIYIVQTSFNIYGAKSSDGFPKPSFSIDSASEIEIMKPLTLPLTMSLPYPASDVTVSVFMVVGQVDELLVQKIQTRAVGNAFSYSVNPDMIGVNQYSICLHQNSADLYMGTLVNSESQRESPNSSFHDVIVDITFQVEKRNIVGKTRPVAVVVTVNDEKLYETELNLTVVKQSDRLPLSGTSFTLMQPGVSVVSPGFPGRTNLSIEIPAESNNNYTITLRTATKSSDNGALSIIAVNPVRYGANLPCEIHPNDIVFATTSSTNDKLMDAGTVIFNVVNRGFESGADVNTLDVEVVVMMMHTAAESEKHELFVSINEQQEQSVNFTVGTTEAYDKPVKYVLKIENKCDDTYQSGTLSSFMVTVKTERNKTPGEFSIETPIPNNLTDSPLAFHSASIISRGRNVVCVQLGKVDAILSDWNIGSGENDRSTMTLPLVCNIEVVDDPAEDKFVLEIKAKIKDEAYILNASSPVTVEFAIGIQFSGNQFWIAMYAFQVEPPTDLKIPGETLVQRVNGLTLTEQHMQGIFPDDIVLQWSIDNVEYHDTAFGWEQAIPGNKSWTINLTRPLIARYVRLVNTNGNCMKDHVIETTTTDLPEMYGAVNMSGPLLQKFMLALDNNTDTCFPLPNKDESSITPYMWVEAKKSVFGLADTTQFSVTIVGEGIQCRNSSGPQVTYLYFPKEASSSSFQGNKIICQHTSNSTVDTTKTECNYMCPCVGQDQCEKFSLLMLNNDTSASYSLCDVSVTEI